MFLEAIWAQLGETMGPNWGIGALNNNLSKIDLKLTGGQAPYERKL
jgi:hypothetical protein